MPTLRPRHMITESDQIALALENAALLWPEAKGDRSKLLKKILETGIQNIETQLQSQQSKRLGAISAASGSLANAWPTNWREERDLQWPQ